LKVKIAGWTDIFNDKMVMIPLTVGNPPGSIFISTALAKRAAALFSIVVLELFKVMAVELALTASMVSIGICEMVCYGFS